MADVPGVCSSATNCLTHTVDPDGTVWLSSTRRPDVRLRVDPDEWASRPATLGGPGELADARHELDVLRGGIANLRQWLSLALGELTQAQAERDEARRAAASWEEWGQGWKGQAEGSRTARDKAWAELDQVRAELAKTVSNFEEFAESVADRRRPTEAAPGALDLDRLKALADAATAGPWYRAKNHSRASVADPDNAIGAFDGPFTRYIAVVGGGGCHGDTDEQSNADAKFIAAAREAVPRLIAELAAATKQGAGWMDEARRQAAERDREFQRAERAEAERDQLRQHILDIDAHATPYGDIPNEPGWVGTYLVTAGALHRALGKIGHSAPNCEAEARLAALKPHARDAGARLLELQAERGELALALEAVTAERDRRGDELRRAQDVIAHVRELHAQYEGRCIECVEYCDCLDRVKELGDDVEVAAALRMCPHSNKPWPCPTVAALGSGEVAPTLASPIGRNP